MTRRHVLTSLLVSLLVYTGCSKSNSQFISMGTAPTGGAFPVVGGAICDVLNQHKGTIDWKMSIKGTKGSQENIRRLQQGELQLGMSNAAISYFASKGESGWDKVYDVRAIATLAPNVATFVTRADSGIQTVADLKGRKVICGPAGAGFRMFIEPILNAHGLAWDDIVVSNATQSGAVDQLADGSADAAFLGGAVPTGAVTQAASTFDIFFIPLDPASRESLIEDYAFFQPAKIPAGTYRGLDSDYEGLNVGAMHLITSSAQDEQLIYEITKGMWENREEIAAQHPAGKAINEKNVARDTGIEYHPGAVRFYEEIGIWPGSKSTGSESIGSESSAATGGDAPAESAPQGSSTAAP